MQVVLPAPDDLLSVASLTRRSRSDSGGRDQLTDGFWRARDPAAGLLQVGSHCRRDALVILAVTAFHRAVRLGCTRGHQLHCSQPGRPLLGI